MGRNPTAEALVRSRKEPQAFAHVYEKHAERLIAFIARRVYDADTAVEILAEVFAKAYFKRKSFKGTTDGEATSWLYSIALHAMSDYFRRSRVEKRATARLGLQLPPPSVEDQQRIIDLAGLEELRSEVLSELAHLPSEQQLAVRLRVIEELPYEQVAHQLGISQDAARARVARGLRALAQALDQYRRPLKEGLI